MVSISENGSYFIFEVKGLHKLWAFKNQLMIPKEHIIKAYQDPESINGSKGIRMPGTEIPRLITAGTFINHGDMIFWDVSDVNKCIIIELKDEQYKKLIIEVEDPGKSIVMLSD